MILPKSTSIGAIYLNTDLTGINYIMDRHTAHERAERMTAKLKKRIYIDSQNPPTTYESWYLHELGKCWETVSALQIKISMNRKISVAEYQSLRVPNNHHHIVEKNVYQKCAMIFQSLTDGERRNRYIPGNKMPPCLPGDEQGKSPDWACHGSGCTTRNQENYWRWKIVLLSRMEDATIIPCQNTVRHGRRIFP